LGKPIQRGLYRLLRKSFMNKYGKLPSAKEVFRFSNEVIIGDNVVYDKETGKRLDHIKRKNVKK
jgi:hypothetical protein